MPKVKTSSETVKTDSIKQLTDAVNKLRKVVETSTTAANSSSKKANDAARRKAADESARKKSEPEKAYEKALKSLEEQRKEDKYQSQLNLARNSANAVMPADRRQFFGASAIGAIAGIDPAIVQMLGIDKLGANLWNSKFGFSAINKRHQRNRQEEKLNEQFGINDSKSKDKYGSVVKDDPNKILKDIARNTKDTANNTKDGKVTTKDGKDKKGGLLSSLLDMGGGLLKKLLIPMLVGMIANAARNSIKEGLANLLGGGDFGNMLGGAIADFFPGAIGGLAAAKKFGVPWWKGALVGGTITFVWPRLVRLLGDIKSVIFGEGNPKAGNLDRYLEKALAGALLGASLTGWKAGSWKAAGIGALLGGLTEFLLARANDLKAMLSGKPTEIKMIGGVIPEEVFGTAIAGATLGLKHGWKAAGIGALFGASVGLISSMIKDTRNQILAIRSGNANPESAFGPWGKIIAPAIAGAAIGAKYGGLKGAAIGAIIGGAIGGIMTLIDKVSKDFAQQQQKSEENVGQLASKVDSKDATNSTDYAYNRKQELEAKKAAGTLTDDEKKELGKIDSGIYRAGKRVEHAKEADTNGDGIITEEELTAWEKSDKGSTWGFGGRAKSQTQMRKLLKESGGKGFSIKDLSDYQLGKYDDSLKAPMQSTSMPTAAQLQDDKNTEATDKNTQTMVQLTEAINNLNNKEGFGQTVVNNNNTVGSSEINAYSSNSSTTGAGIVRTY